MPRRVAWRQLVVFPFFFYASTNDSVDKWRRGTSRAYIWLTILETNAPIIVASQQSAPLRYYLWKQHQHSSRNKVGLCLKKHSLRQLGRFFFGLNSNIPKPSNYVHSAPASTKKHITMVVVSVFADTSKRLPYQPIDQIVHSRRQNPSLRVLKL